MEWDTITNLIQRLQSGTYNPLEIVIELLLIGLSVNWCASVLHGTRGTRLLRGLLVVLVVVTLIVRVVGNPRLQLLYQAFLFGLAFIALIAFQPELRRALIRAGDVRLLRRRSPRSKLIAELLESAAYLSRNRYGALVAIQRDVGLANWTEHGTQLNAEISANLLNSVFYPNAALHDLGVIIRGNRVLAAGCQFPVAESGEVEPGLGSRHRAAIGLSSESDALVLVVSEESGTISLADRGQLVRFLSLDDLEQELESRLSGHASATPRAARSFSDLWRFARRLLVVVPLTVVIWFLADQASLVPPQPLPISLDLRAAADLHIDAASNPLNFTVMISGARRDVDELRDAAATDPLPVSWALRGIYTQTGRHRYEGETLRELLGDLAPLRSHGVSVASVRPASLSYDVREVATVPMALETESGGVRLNVLRYDPPQVRVSLRKSDLERLADSQRKARVDLSGVLDDAPGEDRTLRLPIERDVGGLPILRVEPDEVAVTFRVIAQRKKRNLSKIRVDALASPSFFEQYKIEPRDANEWLLELEVEGDAERVDALRAEDVRAFVPFSADQSATSEFRSADVRILLPAGLHVVGAARQVQFRILLREASSP